jgi:hypothetical protein
MASSRSRSLRTRTMARAAQQRELALVNSQDMDPYVSELQQV